MSEIILGTTPPEGFSTADFVAEDGQGHIEELPASGSRPAESRWMRIFARMLESLQVAQSVAANSGFTGTSATSITIGTGSKVFTTQAGKGFYVGQLLIIVDVAAPTTNFMVGTVTDYTGTALTVSVSSVGGSGTLSNWSIGPKQGDVSGISSATDYATTAYNGTSGKALRQIVSWVFDSSDNYNASDKTLKRVALLDYSEVVQPVTGIATTVIDIELGGIVEMSQAVNITSMTFSNPASAASTRACWLTIIRTKDNSSTPRTIAWPASVTWDQGTPPVLSSTNNAVDIYSFLTINGGTTWRGFIGGRAFA